MAGSSSFPTTRAPATSTRPPSTAAPGAGTPPTAPPAPRGARVITAADPLGELDCDETGQASVVEVRGTVHWLTHADGPGRAISVDPNARARDPRILGREGKVIWVTDADGPAALEIA